MEYIQLINLFSRNHLLKIEDGDIETNVSIYNFLNRYQVFCYNQASVKTSTKKVKMVDSIYFKIAYIISSYLLGSVVFGYIMSKIFSKKDFGKLDRPGTAGAGRQYGIKAGLPTLIFDVGKGVAVPLIGKAIGLDMITIAIACTAVLVGHNWPVFFKFRGGGGIATTMGIAGVLIPVPFWIAFGTGVVVGFIYKYTLGKKHEVNPNVVGSALGIFLLPVLVYIFGQPLEIIILFIIIFIIILTRGIILHFMYRNVSTAN